MPRPALALALAFAASAVFAALAAGCVGEASVSFQGAVVEGAGTGHAFEPAPAVYEDSSDPLTANPSCEEGCPPVFLNFTLARPSP